MIKFEKVGFDMIILGIDPGLAIVGWAVIETHRGNSRPLAYGAIRTPANTLIESRLTIIESDLCEIINKYKPDEMAIEELFFNQNITTAITVAEARGVIIMTAAQNGVPVFEYTPLQVKQSVVGYGKAEKKQVMLMVSSLLKLAATPKLDDTCDALAIAVCHAHTGNSRLKNFYNIK